MTASSVIIIVELWALYTIWAVAIESERRASLD